MEFHLLFKARYAQVALLGIKRGLWSCVVVLMNEFGNFINKTMCALAYGFICVVMFGKKSENNSGQI